MMQLTTTMNTTQLTMMLTMPNQRPTRRKPPRREPRNTLPRRLDTRKLPRSESSESVFLSEVIILCLYFSKKSFNYNSSSSLIFNSKKVLSIMHHPATVMCTFDARCQRDSCGGGGRSYSDGKERILRKKDKNRSRIYNNF